MNQKTVIIVIIAGAIPECYGSFKKFCKAKGLSYQYLLNSKRAPKLGESVTIGEFEVHKIECK